MTDPRERLQLELLADRVEGEDLLGLYVRAESQIELEMICTFLSIKIFVSYLGNLLRPAGELEAAVLGVHGVVLDVDLTLAGVYPLGQPGHVTIVPHLLRRL